MADVENAVNRGSVKLWSRYSFGVVGLALFFAWVFNLMHSSVYLALYESFGAFFVMAIFGSAALVMVIALWFISHFSAFNNVTITALLVVSAMPTVAELLGLLGLVPFEGLMVLWAFAGAGTAALYTFWGIFLSSFDYGRSMPTPMEGMAIAAVIAVVTGVLEPTAAKIVTMLLPAFSLFAYFLAQSYHKPDHPDSIFVELKSFNSRTASLDPLLLTPILITVINSVCLGFAVYYLFVAAPLGTGISILIFSSILLLLCVIRIVDIIKFKVVKPLYTALTIMPYMAICILPLSYLDAWFAVISCCVMLGISVFNVMVNRSTIFGYAERSKKTPPLFFLYDCAGTIGGIVIGTWCSFLVFGASYTGQIENIYVPSILMVAITIIWALIDRKNLEKQLSLMESSESRDAAQRDDPFHSWREKMTEFSSYYHLSPRQYEVLLLLAKGRNAGYIKEKLVISNHTAKAHIYNIYQKTSVSSRQELISLIEEFDKKSL